MSPLNLILSHPYNMLLPDGREQQVLYSGMKRGNHGILYCFKTDRYNCIELNEMQIKQLLQR